jgi:hypothetical protein
MEEIDFTFVAIEKNGSGTLTRSYQLNSKQALKEAWKEFSDEADELFGSWRYEIHPEEEITKEVEEWFADLDLDVEDGFSGIF